MNIISLLAENATVPELTTEPEMNMTLIWIGVFIIGTCLLIGLAKAWEEV